MDLSCRRPPIIGTIELNNAGESKTKSVANRGWYIRRIRYIFDQTRTCDSATPIQKKSQKHCSIYHNDVKISAFSEGQYFGHIRYAQIHIMKIILTDIHGILPQNVKKDMFLPVNPHHLKPFYLISVFGILWKCPCVLLMHKLSI